MKLQLVRFAPLLFLALAASVMLSLVRKPEYVTIEIEIMDCRDSDNVYLDKLDVYKDGARFTELNPKYENTITLDSLQPGLYEFRYHSMFDVEVTRKLDAAQAGKYKVIVCTNEMDYAKETYVPVIDRLKPGESYMICCKSEGCFHSGSDTITIARSTSGYTSEYAGQLQPLDTNQTRAIRHFEFQLHHIHGGRCTTSEAYKIIYAGKQVESAMDRTCEWQGFFNLLATLGYTADK